MGKDEALCGNPQCDIQACACETDNQGCDGYIKQQTGQRVAVMFRQLNKFIGGNP